MKNIRQCLAAIALTCVFTAATFAGQIDTMIAQPPPPPSSAGEMTTWSAEQPPSATADGQMTTTVAGDMTTMGSEAVDPVVQAALSVLQGALALF
jgi:hypothetical protein